MSSTLVQQIAEAHCAINAAGGRLVWDDPDAYCDQIDRPLAVRHLERALDALERALAAAGGTEADLDAAALAYSQRLVAEAKAVGEQSL